MPIENWANAAISKCVLEIIQESRGSSLTVTTREIQKRLYVKNHPTRVISPNQRVSRQIREILLEMGFEYVPASLNGKRPGKYRLNLVYSRPELKSASGMCAI